MRIHKPGINYPMHAVAFDDFDDDAARDYVVKQVEARRPSYRSKAEARDELADEIGVSRGTLYNIWRERSKGLRGLIRDKIHAHKLQWLEAEFVRIERELAVARHRGADASSREMQAVEASRREIRCALDGAIHAELERRGR
jgi:hypothetical protein